MMPSRFLDAIRSSDDSTMAARCSRSSSVWRRSDTLRKTRITPSIRPSSSRIISGVVDGKFAAVATDEDRVVRRPTTCPVASTFSTGFVTGCRVVSLTMRKTSARSRPCARHNQPVSPSAIGFMKRTHPCASVAMTASPMHSSRGEPTAVERMKVPHLATPPAFMLPDLSESARHAAKEMRTARLAVMNLPCFETVAVSSLACPARYRASSRSGH